MGETLWGKKNLGDKQSSAWRMENNPKILCEGSLKENALYPASGEKKYQ